MITTINEFRLFLESNYKDTKIGFKNPGTQAKLHRYEADKFIRDEDFTYYGETLPEIEREVVLMNNIVKRKQIGNDIHYKGEFTLNGQKYLIDRDKVIASQVNEENAVQQQVTNTTLNSDKTTQLTGYENDMGYYNSNKNKLLLLSQQPTSDKTESDANKIINGNIYLGMAWKLYKMQTTMKADETKLGNNQISAEEKTQIQTNVNTNKQELAKLKKELDDKIATDLGQIKKM